MWAASGVGQAGQELLAKLLCALGLCCNILVTPMQGPCMAKVRAHEDASNV